MDTPLPASPGDAVEAPAEEALSVRIQGTVQGSTSAFVIKELTTCSQVRHGTVTIGIPLPSVPVVHVVVSSG